MADDERPDPMQSFYLGQPPLPERVWGPAEESVPLRPLPPMKLHWSGLVSIVAFVLFLAVVSRFLSSFAASVLAVIALGGLALWVIVRRKAVLESPDGVWLGDDGVADGDFGGDGGGDG